jgi:hypothetical protein
MERKRHGRKLLIASIGVAAVSYVACGGDTNDGSGGGGSSGTAVSTGGNGNTAGSANTGGGNTGGGNTGGGGYLVANLVAPDFDSGSGGSDKIQDAAAERVPDVFVIVANLMVVPTPDAKADSK